MDIWDSSFNICVYLTPQTFISVVYLTNLSKKIPFKVYHFFLDYSQVFFTPHLDSGSHFFFFYYLQLPWWALILLSLSKRVHSIFVLRLFNDCFAMTLLHAALATLLYQKWHLGLILFRLCIYFLHAEFDIKYRYVTIYICVCVCVYCFVQWGCFNKDECTPLCSSFVTPHDEGILLSTHLSFSECTSEFLRLHFLYWKTFCRL